MRLGKTGSFALVFGLLLLLGVGPVLAAAPEIKDVPPGHWAYDAVRLLVSKGYISLNADGAFQGNQAVDRYTLAQTIAQMLNDIGSGKTSVSSDDVQLLRKLTNDYRAELVQYYAEQQKTAKALEETTKRTNVLDEKINEAIVAVGNLSTRADQLQNDLNSRVKGVDGQLQKLLADIANMQAEAANLRRLLEDQAGANTTEHDAIRRTIKDSEDKLRAEAQALIAAAKSDQDNKRSTVEARTSSLEIRATDLEKRLNAQENRSTATTNQLNQLTDQVTGLGDHISQTDIRQQADKKQLEDRIAASVAALRQEVLGIQASLSAEGTQKAQVIQNDMQSELNRLNIALASLDAALKQQSSDQTKALRDNAVQDKDTQDRLAQLEQKQQSYQASTEATLQNHTNQLTTQANRINILETKQNEAVQAQNDALSALNTELEKLKGQQAQQQQAMIDTASQIAAAKDDASAQVLASKNDTAGQLSALQAKLDNNVKDLAVQMQAGDAAVRNELQSALAQQEKAWRDATGTTAQELTARTDTLGQSITAANEKTQALESRVASAEKELNSHSESLAAQQLAVDKLKADLEQKQSADIAALRSELAQMVAQLQSKHDADLAQLAAQQKAETARYEQALAALTKELDDTKQELAQVRKELVQANARILATESKLGLSDEQLAELDRRINVKVDEYLSSTVMRERQLEQDINNLKAQYEASQKKTQDDIGSAKNTAFVTSTLAALLGVLVK